MYLDQYIHNLNIESNAIKVIIMLFLYSLSSIISIFISSKLTFKKSTIEIEKTKKYMILIILFFILFSVLYTYFIDKQVNLIDLGINLNNSDIYIILLSIFNFFVLLIRTPYIKRTILSTYPNYKPQLPRTTLKSVVIGILVIIVVALVFLYLVDYIAESSKKSLGLSEAKMIVSKVNNYCAAEEMKEHLSSNKNICSNGVTIEEAMSIANVVDAKINKIVYNKKVVEFELEKFGLTFTLQEDGEFKID